MEKPEEKKQGTDQVGYKHLSELAGNRPRDAHGHFIPENPAPTAPSPTPVASFLQKEIKIEKTSDDNTLVDVHVNNPLKRIQVLLEEIKKQKAFTFSIKGSLGLAGIILVITAFGIFGGGKALCEKGIQTASGRVQILSVAEEYVDPDLSWWERLLQTYLPSKKTLINRIVIFPENGAPIHLVTRFVNKLVPLNKQQAIVTGTLDSCSSTLTIKDEQAIEPQVY